MCHIAMENKIKKIEDINITLQRSVGIGLMLAKQQPELTDSYTEYARYMGEDRSDDIEFLLDMYERFKESLEEEAARYKIEHE